jgi:hypothetical protein
MEKMLDIKLPCGGEAFFDRDCGIGYRCYDCMAIVGSVGQPRRCKEEANKWEAWKQLGGKEWDYFEGQ